MEKSKTEINLCRLLSKCELRARDYASNDDWRLEKYLEAASAMLLSLIKGCHETSSESIKDYTRRIDFLKKLVESKKELPLERVVAAQMLPHSTDTLIKEIQQKTTSKYVEDVRHELFRGTEIRQRRDEKTSGEDLDALLKHHHDTQEFISEEMMLMARALKEQSQLANQVIKRDVETMHKSSRNIESNEARLAREALILQEHNRRAWKCWLWVLLVIVFMTFINMVIFMKFVKK